MTFIWRRIRRFHMGGRRVWHPGSPEVRHSQRRWIWLPAGRRPPGTPRSSASSTSSNPPSRRRSRGLSAVAGGTVSVAATRGHLLRHTRPRPGRAPRDIAPPYRRIRRRLAPQAARRPRHPHRGPGAAGRPRRRRAGAICMDVVLAIVRDRPLGPVAADLDQPHRRRALRPRRLGARRVQRRQGDGVGRRRRRRAAVARSGSWNWPRARRSRGLLDRLANRLLDAGAVPRGTGPSWRECWRPGSTTTARPNPRSTIRSGAARWPSRSTSWSSGIARCARTSTTRCTRCG